MLISLHKSLQLFASSSAPHSEVIIQCSDSYSLSADGDCSSPIYRFRTGAQQADEGDVSSAPEVLSVAGTRAADCRHALGSERREHLLPPDQRGVPARGGTLQETLTGAFFCGMHHLRFFAILQNEMLTLQDIKKECDMILFLFRLFLAIVMVIGLFLLK